MVHNNPHVDLVNDNEYKNLVKFCLFILKILNENHILTSFKGRNSVENLQKLTLYNLNIELVNDNMYKKFGYILCINSQDMELKPNSEMLIKGRNSVANFRKTTIWTRIVTIKGEELWSVSVDKSDKNCFLSLVV